MTKRMHLIGFYMNSPINHTALSWADPDDDRVEGMRLFEHWKRLARTLERGRFDAAFFADTPGGMERYKDSFEDYVRYGVTWPCHDPMALLGVMLAETKHLGLAVTLSTAGTHPYHTVRRLSTLDYLSGGRVGWNIVSGHLRGEHRALGLDQIEHDKRYDQADEYMDICHALWNGIQPGAILADRSTGEFADPAKVAVVDFVGAHYRCHTIPPTLPSAQGRPVLFQAGSSGRGQEFALKHSDVVFSIQARVEAMKAFVDKLKDSSISQGRTEPPKVIFGIQCVLGGTEAEAKRRQAEIFERIPLDAALSRMSGTLGIDFSKIDLDRPLAVNTTDASRGMLMALANMTGDGNATARDAARVFGATAGMPQLVGTAEQVADQLEHLWRSSGCHGFNVTPTTNIRSIETFVDEVVPLLQARGIFRTDYESETLRDNFMD
ncbi:NtaA/DmoA family FMN-dependent monooxygenase [Bradyrhizobium monzae]|uniref:NtaA/DmoA family FMN-dependent monooxygenase n=1 Tax=Bradyrhizobium sp. Oc8 TaxID=2876780 RepID=UPI001EEB8826